MKILVAEDDAINSRMLEAVLRRWKYEPVLTQDGAQAWEWLSQPDGPAIAILNWMMPGLDGLEVCRRIRASKTRPYVYCILLTARNKKADTLAGLEAGADDYLTKPFDKAELRARLRNAVRIVTLENDLLSKINQMEASIARIKKLEGLLPICSYCKKVRSRADYWQQVESYVCEHSDLQFTHGLCPACEKRVRKDAGLPSSENG